MKITLNVFIADITLTISTCTSSADTLVGERNTCKI